MTESWKLKILFLSLQDSVYIKHQFDISPPKLSEVKQAVKKARSASAPGPNGVPYSVYKNASDVLKNLWKNTKVLWDKQIIPKAWRRAGGVFIPKEKKSTTIEQFRQINLLNIEGKIRVLAQRLTQYLKQNYFIDTSIQKAGITGFSGCLEHNSIIWHQIQMAKREGKDLHVLFLDLANAYGSVPHSVLWAAFDFFPGADQNYKSSETLLPGSTVLPYNIRLNHKLATARGTEGIMAGCTISPFAFTMAIKVIIRASKWVVGGEWLQCNQRLPPIRAYMDDLTTLTTTVPCTKRLLESFIKI